MPSIAFITVEPQRAQPGSNVTLSWDIDANEIVFEIQNVNGQAVRPPITVPPRFSQEVTIPSGVGAQAIFRFTATRGAETITQSVAVEVGCGEAWFFGAGRIDASLCPAGPPAAQDGRIQFFERGYMIWVPTNGINRVYVMYEGTSQGPYILYEPRDPSGAIPAAPTDRFQPQDEFAGIWLDVTAPTTNSWQDEIGWGVTGSVTIPITVQALQGSSSLYIGAGSDLFYTEPNADQRNIGIWRRIS